MPRKNTESTKEEEFRMDMQLYNNGEKVVDVKIAGSNGFKAVIEELLRGMEVSGV